MSTPFALTATATPSSGDGILTYTWEQMNNESLLNPRLVRQPVVLIFVVLPRRAPIPVICPI